MDAEHNLASGIEARLADMTLKWLFVSSLPLLALSLLRMVEIGWQPVMLAHLCLVGLLGGGLGLRGHLPVSARAATLIVFFFALGVSTTLHNQAFVWGGPYFCMGLLLTAIFFNRRITAVLTFASFGFGAAHEVWMQRAIGMHSLLNLVAVSALSVLAAVMIGGLKDALASLVVTLHEKNESLLKTREEALAASQTKSRFLANMSHELRTPMSGILGIAELLRDRPLDAQGREYVDMICSCGDALLALLNDILDISKIEANKMAIEEVPLLPAKVVQDVAAMMRVQAEKKGLAVELDLRGDLPSVCGDPIRLRQVLLNLVSNAIKFTDKGAVCILVEEVARDGDDVELLFVIRDNGIGIKDDELSLLFHSFQQVDASTARKYGGTGLGLAISKHLVGLMGGEIGVRSEHGVGSEFWFTLPLRISATPPQEEVAATTLPTLDPMGRRLLLAEDNEVNRLIISTLLDQLGFTDVEAVCNGEEALERLSDRDFGLVLMDVQMPELDGHEAVRRLRAQSASARNVDVPVIALTANAMQGDEESCLAAGMNDYLRKPIVLESLAEKIALWLPGEAPVGLRGSRRA